MQQREADREQKIQKQAASHDAYRAANWLQMSAGEPLNGSKCLNAPAGFLDMKYQQFWWFLSSHISTISPENEAHTRAFLLLCHMK